jgi:DeoD family purine-nucleoside phosphorylase
MRPITLQSVRGGPGGALREGYWVHGYGGPVPDTPHLNPAAELAERVLLPGDPHRALTMAQALLDSPRMFNARRGLWGYTGRAADGEPATIQSTGMGGPSAAIVVEELIRLGARRLVRTGTCGALDGELRLGDVIAPAEAIAADGASRALGADGRIEADRALTDALASAGATRAAAIVSTDLFYDPHPARAEAWREAGAAAVEMEAAAVFATAARHGVPAGCVLMVTDLLADGGRERMEHDEIEERAVRLGEIALGATARR